MKRFVDLNFKQRDHSFKQSDLDRLYKRHKQKILNPIWQKYHLKDTVIANTALSPTPSPKVIDKLQTYVYLKRNTTILYKHSISLKQRYQSTYSVSWTLKD